MMSKVALVAFIGTAAAAPAARHAPVWNRKSIQKLGKNEQLILGTNLEPNSNARILPSLYILALTS